MLEPVLSDSGHARVFLVHLGDDHRGRASANDAKSYAPEMHRAAEAILATRKRRGGTEFIVHVRNVTDAAIKVNVPFGIMERVGRMDEEAYRAVREANRQRYCAPRHPTSPERARPQEPEASPRPTSGKGDQGFRLGGARKVVDKHRPQLNRVACPRTTTRSTCTF